MTDVITYIIPQTVCVRKYEVDLDKFKYHLIQSKKEHNLSNVLIASALNVSLTKVEHWFRKDKYFAVPDAEYWFQLKQMLNLDDCYDEYVTEFEYRLGTYDKSERCYHIDGIAPTLLCSDDIRICYE